MHRPLPRAVAPVEQPAVATQVVDDEPADDFDSESF